MEILWILVQIIASSYGFICVLALSKWRFSRRITITIAAACIVIITIINFFAVRDLSYLLNEYPALDFIYRVSNILMVVIIACILIRQQTVQIVFTFLSACVFVLIVDTFTISIRIWLGMYPVELFLELILYSFMTFLVIRIRKPFLEISEYMQKRLWPLCLIPILLLVCFFLQISVPTPLERNHGNMPVALLLCFISASVYGLYFLLFRVLRAQGRLENNILVMKLYASSLEHQNNITNQNTKKFALYRHDLRHVVQMLLTCLDNHDMDGARNLVSSLDKNLRETDSVTTLRSFTGHKLLDGTINYYLDLARESGIDFTVRMDKIDNVTADKTELAVVFANALENAIHACRQLPDNTERIVRLDGHWHGRQYFLELVNTCTGEVHFDSVTRLPISSEEGHGFGSQSIAWFARKNGAVLQYHLEGSQFCLRLLMEKKTDES